MKRLLLKFKDYNDQSASAVYSKLIRFSEKEGIDMDVWDFRDFASSL